MKLEPRWGVLIKNRKRGRTRAPFSRNLDKGTEAKWPEERAVGLRKQGMWRISQHSSSVSHNLCSLEFNDGQTDNLVAPWFPLSLDHGKHLHFCTELQQEAGFPNVV